MEERPAWWQDEKTRADAVSSTKTTSSPKSLYNGRRRRWVQEDKARAKASFTEYCKEARRIDDGCKMSAQACKIGSEIMEACATIIFVEAKMGQKSRQIDATFDDTEGGCNYEQYERHSDSIDCLRDGTEVCRQRTKIILPSHLLQKSFLKPWLQEDKARARKSFKEFCVKARAYDETQNVSAMACKAGIGIMGALAAIRYAETKVGQKSAQHGIIFKSTEGGNHVERHQDQVTSVAG